MSSHRAPECIAYQAYPEGGGPQSALGQIFAGIAYIIQLRNKLGINTETVLEALQLKVEAVSKRQGGNPISGQGLPPVEEY